MKEDNIISVILTITFIVVLFGAFIANEKDIEKLEIELTSLQAQKQELQIKNEELEKEKTVIPEIDCKEEMQEGDIRVGILIELYNPFGEWVKITEENARYQVSNGGRIITCKIK